MEADISIWRKTGHFYFALTQICHQCRCKMRMSGLSQSRNVRFHGWPRALWRRSESL